MDRVGQPAVCSERFSLGARASRPHFGAGAWSKAFTFAKMRTALSIARSASASSWKCGRDARAPRDGLVIGDSRSVFGAVFSLGARASRPHFGTGAWSKAFTVAKRRPALSIARSASALSWKCGRDARAPRDGLVVGDSRSVFGAVFSLGARASRPHFGAGAWSKTFTFAKRRPALSIARSASASSWKCGRDARAPRERNFDVSASRTQFRWPTRPDQRRTRQVKMVRLAAIRSSNAQANSLSSAVTGFFSWLIRLWRAPYSK